MRTIFSFIFLCALGYGAFWVHENRPEWKNKALELVMSHDVPVLEVHYEPGGNFGMGPSMELHPLLLLNVKYSIRDNTQEGMILWDMVDGEMILDAGTWEKSHGYADCMEAQISPTEFNLLRHLALRVGVREIGSLRREMQLGEDEFASIVKRCHIKKMVVPTERGLRLHVQDPKFADFPTTSIDARLSTKTLKQAKLRKSVYSESQIKKIAQAAFNSDFAIRNSQKIYLPVYAMESKDSRGVTLTNYINAFNGLPLEP